MEKKTPIYDWHSANGAKLSAYENYVLPLHYETGIIKEHIAVREKAGIFDVSHMGEFLIKGKDAFALIQRLFSNDFSNLREGRVRYTLMCTHEGGIIDDLLVYRMEKERYFLVVNAVNIEKDAEWIKKHMYSLDVDFEDCSDDYALIALQGPASEAILKEVCTTIPAQYYSFIEKGSIASIECLISKTGYTGESGFEIYCKNEYASAIWEALIKAGSEYGLLPCGLGARDTLRLEACMPLYGHEMNESINPFQAGLSFAVKLQKEYFIGKAALLGKENLSPNDYIRTGVKALERGIIRENCPLYYQGEKIGYCTSGTMLPFLKQSMAMAYIYSKYNKIGMEVEVELRSGKIKAEICSLPFYKSPNT